MRLLYCPLLFIVFSCADTATNRKSSVDSLRESVRISEIKDSLEKNINKKIGFDTAGIYNAPVKIISAKLVRREYSEYRDVALVFKNVSGKNISAISFSWYGETAFGEPADMGSMVLDGFGGGFDDDGLRAGRTGSGHWSVLSRNAKKLILAWPTKVAFEDGTKWETH
jgi:hypothetical protein